MAKTKKSNDEVTAAFKRILDHAESHGEVYDGAVSDIATVKEALGITDDDDSDDGDDDKNE